MAQESVLDQKCPSCGSVLKFDIKTQLWVCKYCGSKFTLEQLESKSTKSAASKEANQKKEPAKKTSPKIKYTSYKCDNCGAEIICDELTTATFCVYCGNTAIIKSKLSEEFRPDYIIPFKKTMEDAKEAFLSLKKGRPFIPKNFLSTENIEKIKGVYIPFWLYDETVGGSMSLRGEIVHIRRTIDWEYITTEFYKLDREGTVSFERIPCDGSTRFADDMMNSIEPFNYKDMVSYNHAYLSGFYAEKYDVAKEDCGKIAEDRALESTRSEMISSAIGYTGVHVAEENLVSENTNTKYALLPVYMVNIKYKDKMYLFAMNGQTGKFIGNIPIAHGKVVLYFMIYLIIAILIGIAFNYGIHLITGGLV